MNKKLFIALPCHETVDPHFFASCMNLQVASQIQSDIIIAPLFGDAAIGRARNNLAHKFLKSDCDKLLFIDSDLVFAMHHINRIQSHDVDVVGGTYFKKDEGEPQIVCNGFPSAPPCGPNGLQEVLYVGTGFMCISRKVFEVIIQELGKDLWYSDDNTKEKMYDFFKMGVYEYPDKTRRWLSEDWFFNQMAKDCGFKIYMDMRCILAHSGNTLYPTAEQQAKVIKHEPIPAQEEVEHINGCGEVIHEGMND